MIHHTEKGLAQKFMPFAMVRCTAPGEAVMLIAHLVPGYFAVVQSQACWKPEWSRKQRVTLWIAALASTAVPDLDVMYNGLFRGFMGHTILWTHSLFPYLGIGLVWWLIRRTGRKPYLQTMIGLVAVGGLSHLALDVVAHGTPLLYPLSLHLFGSSSLRLLDHGLRPYLTDPVFLLEPFLIALAVVHWIAFQPRVEPRLKKILLFGVVSGWAGFSVAFLLVLPTLRGM